MKMYALPVIATQFRPSLTLIVIHEDLDEEWNSSEIFAQMSFINNPKKGICMNISWLFSSNKY
jgi:hypothetical protein